MAREIGTPREIEIAVRFFSEVSRTKSQSGSDLQDKPQHGIEPTPTVRDSLVPNPTVQDGLVSSPEFLSHNEICVFDTETTEGRIKNFLFGQFFIISTRDGSPVYNHITGNNDVTSLSNILIERYMVVADKFNEVYLKGNVNKALRVIEDYTSKNDYKLYPTKPDGSGLHYWPLKDFLNEVFIEKMVMGIPIIGFNLQFDLSRIARGVSVSKDKKSYKFSLLQPSQSGSHPMIKIQPIDSKKGFIKIRYDYDLSPKWIAVVELSSKKTGCFIDLRTVLFALTSEVFSLKRATSENYYDTFHKKMEVSEHGKITSDTMDVLATLDLYGATMLEYQKHSLLFESHFPIEKLYSPASVGKAYFKLMGIKPFNKQNPDFDRKMLGIAMTTFYAGRSETHIKSLPIKTYHVDVHSMYPSVYILQGLWELLIAEKTETRTVTEEIKDLVEKATLDDVLKKEFWKNLRVIVKIQPDKDLLPVRGRYTDAFNIGLNYLSSEEPLYYSLADIINEKILTGKIPNIIEAIEVIPVGRQEGLKEINFFNENPFNPYEEDFFKSVIEARTRIKGKMKRETDENKRSYLNSVQLGLKILANSTNYGINVELNDKSLEDGDDLDIYALNQISLPNPSTSLGSYEEPGYYFNPFLATFITSGAHLMLGIIQRIIEDNGGTYALMDTDSAFIVDRNDIGKPIENQNGNPEQIASIVMDKLRVLYPYDDNPNNPLLEAEEDNNIIDKNGEKLPLYVYSVSSKRYATFTVKKNGDGEVIDLEVIEGKSHGLPYKTPIVSFQNPTPFSSSPYRIVGGKKEKAWNDLFWEYLLNREILNKEVAIPFDMKQPVAISYNLNQISDYILVNKRNNKTDYFHRIKPFDFMLRLLTVNESDGILFTEMQLIPEYFCQRHHDIVKGLCHNQSHCEFNKTCLAGVNIVPISPNMENVYLVKDWRDLYTGIPLIQQTSEYQDLNRKETHFRPRTLEDISEKYLSHAEAKYNDDMGVPSTKDTKGELFPCHVIPSDIKYHGKEMKLSEEDSESVLLDTKETCVIDREGTPSHSHSQLTSPLTQWEIAVREIRGQIEKGEMTLGKLSKKLRIAKGLLSKYLRGKVIPNAKVVERLVRYTKDMNQPGIATGLMYKPLSSRYIGPDRSKNNMEGKTFNARSYFNGFLPEAIRLFPNQFKDLYGVLYVTVNSEITNWKEDKTKERKLQLEKELETDLRSIIIKSYGRETTISYGNLLEWEVRYSKKRIKGRKVITILEVCSPDGKIYTLPLESHPVNKKLVKGGYLPTIKRVRKHSTPVKENLGKEILEQSGWVMMKDVLQE